MNIYHSSSLKTVASVFIVYINSLSSVSSVLYAKCTNVHHHSYQRVNRIDFNEFYNNVITDFILNKLNQNVSICHVHDVVPYVFMSIT